MTSVIAEDPAFNIRKRQSFKIPEDVWREKVASEEHLHIDLATSDNTVINRKGLIIGIIDKRLVVALVIQMKTDLKLKGSGRVIIKKPGKVGFGEESYDDKDLSKLRKISSVLWISKFFLEDEGILYNEEEFLKNHLENGFVTVEAISHVSVNGVKVEDKKMKGKEDVVRDVNNFCNDKSTSDFLVISQGEEIPCHKIILCSRCPVIADGLAAQMSEDISGRWTVMDSNPEAVKYMLHFLYTGEVRGVETRPTELLHLATFYRLPALEKASKEELVRRLTPENAVETLVNMDKFAANDGAVKEKVIGYIKKNAKKVVEGKDWKVFSENYVYLVTDIVKALVN